MKRAIQQKIGRIISVLLALSCVSFGFATSDTNNTEPYADEISSVSDMAIEGVAMTTNPLLSAFTNAGSDTPVLRFACMSDLHLDEQLTDWGASHENTDQFRTALAAAYAKGYTDLFVCGGDISSYGRTSVWKSTRQMIQNAGYSNILWGMGNHEYGTAIENMNGDEDFLDFTGYSNIYYHTTVAGYHFIVLACEAAEIIQSSYGDDQASWFGRELEAAVAEDPTKPVFVISHYPTSKDGVGSRLSQYLEKYDNVFFFWGHSHNADYESYPITKYMSLNTGYVASRMGSVHYGSADVADELLVDVYEDRVVLTMDRSDGPSIANNATTVYLRKDPDSGFGQMIRYDAKNLLSCTAGDLENGAKLCFANYDSDGQLSDICMQTAGISGGFISLDECGCTLGNESGIVTSGFLVDANFSPLVVSGELPISLSF